MPSDRTDEEVVSTYLQKLCGDNQKLAALAVQVANPAPVEEVAAAPMAVSTPEKAIPETTPAAEEPQTLVNPPKVPWPVAPYKFPATLQCHRPLCPQLYNISTFVRESLRHTMTAGKASTQGCEMAKELHTLGVMTAELCKVHKLQQKQTDLPE